jgi:CRP-like cAMP-binding protein
MGAVSGRAAAWARSTYPKDAVIYSEGDGADGWFEILAGVVRTCRYFPNGNRQVTGFFFQGHVFGVEEDAYRATAEAVTETVILRHGRRPLLRRPDGAGAYPLNLALEDAEARVELLGLKGAQARLAGFILAMTGERGCCELPMHRDDIADYLAVDVATVSRLLGQFVRHGLVSLQGRRRYRIRDAARLRSLAAGGSDRGMPG